MNKTGIAITSLLGGMVLGAAIAMLTTPQSGPELRRKVKDLIDDEVYKVREKIEDMRDRIEEKMEEVRCKCDE